MQISILLADDHALLRGTLGSELNAEPDLSVVASVGSTDEAIAEAVRLRPMIVLMDIDIPGVLSFDAVHTIQTRCPGTRGIFLSAFCHDQYIEQALAVKAWGYIVKTESEKVVIAAIRKVAMGVTYFSPAVQDRIVFEGGVPRLVPGALSRVSTLSNREIEVLRYVARGLSMKEIARMMTLSEHTIHRHTSSLMDKLDIHDRVGLARYAIREGLATA
jgi:DNA-binding NarL/FixJ family response regulator